ncbi:hypothetical protein K435DRAFT_818984 [Dendrothele bispora CBS 962.96]|uniref:Oxidase ustYa n=1 Tax=Dendrothele bispora (strain CBS 962.96) TaxID=1314807 RepID=A0A4S8M6X9_DENBC|nr:hypothetical protein K435DRAFT_818984 [Dendrothele bispora CBS 962.96]
MKFLTSLIISGMAHLVGDDFPEHLPINEDVQSRVVVFDDTDDFPIQGVNATERWQSIYPPGYGFVRLGENSRLLCVAMFHQLHCLEKMRIFLDNPNNTGVGFPHQHHCMNYLRQNFLCHADLTLEPFAKGINLDGGLEMMSGVGVEHSCTDWDMLYGITGTNYRQWKESWDIPEPKEA